MVGKTLILILVMLLGCGSSNPIKETYEPIPLELHMDLPMRDGYYRFDYPTNRPHSYTSVLYQTEPMTRVFWDSEDYFCILWMWDTICNPIINYSTYSDGVDGSGKQMIYLYQPFIGDTLMVKGCIDENNCKTMEFIVE